MINRKGDNKRQWQIKRLRRKDRVCVFDMKREGLRQTDRQTEKGNLLCCNDTLRLLRSLSFHLNITVGVDGMGDDKSIWTNRAVLSCDDTIPFLFPFLAIAPYPFLAMPLRESSL